MLGLARSFRSARLQSLIQHQQERFTVFAQIQRASGARAVGFSRDRSGVSRMRINGQALENAAQLAQELPLQIIHPESFQLLSGAPRLRRQFLDWGVFHVEPDFFAVWRRLHKVLRQRNSSLRHATLDEAMRSAWDHELAQSGSLIDQYRRDYIVTLRPIFEMVLHKLLPIDGLALSYYRGWDKERPLAEVLRAAWVRDQQMGATQFGPQRADLRLRLDGLNVVDVLSRGQQKLVVCALKIAQGFLMRQAQSEGCVYLVDDLTSELDKAHRDALCALLEELRCQVFITGIDDKALRGCWSAEASLAAFHVEHGSVVQQSAGSAK